MPPKRVDASGVIRRVLSKPPSARHISPRQLQQVADELFPRVAAPAAVSAGWRHALEVAVLARSCRAPRSAVQAGSASQAERDVIAHMLNRGRFPVEAWHVPTRLLDRWRDLGPPLAGPAQETERPLFPPFQSLEAAKEMMRQLSFAQLGAALRREPWLEALDLYDVTVASLTDPQSPLAAAPHEAATLKRMRHILLTTLLDANRWQEAARVFRHALYQRDMPGHITTGYLMQQLGQRGAWQDVLRLYDLSVRLVVARAGVPGAAARDEGREWGTAVSLAMEAVSGHCPGAVPDMVDRLVAASRTSVAAGRSDGAAGMTQLDGHFLAAVQRLPSAQARLDILHVAKHNQLLDFYKLIRGLVSRGQWVEALALYREAALPASSGGAPALSRKELGKSRLHLLHASSVDNVEDIVAALQEVRQKMNGGGAGAGAFADDATASLRLNDAEVETVLSKALHADESGCASFWRFGLAVLHANYPDWLAQDTTTVGSDAADVRAPSVSALSLFVHDHHLPWETALALAERVDKQSHSRHSPPSREHAPRTDTSPSVSPSVLLWNAVADLLSHQGQSDRSFAIAVSVMQREGTSPSAEFLLRCPEARLPAVLETLPALDGRVLYHVLHQTPSHAPALTLNASGQLSSETMVAVRVTHSSSGATWLPKSFVVLSAWMAVRTGQGFLTAETAARQSPSSGACSWLELVPASVHCEVLKKLQSPTVLIAQQPDVVRCELIARYLRHTLLTPTSTRQQAPPQLAKSYAIAFEGVLGLASIRPSASDAERVSYACDVLSAVTTRVHFLPPTHLLLPQPLSRLLPRFHVSTARTEPTSAARVALAGHLLRCCHCQLLAAHRPVITSGDDNHRHRRSPPPQGRAEAADVSRLPQYREPAFYHALLKLCCRIAEYETSRSQWDFTARTTTTTLAAGTRACPDAHELVAIGCKLLQWQEEQCGLRSVSEASLTLLYHLCASAQSNASVEGTPQRWLQALALTRHLALRHAATRDKDVEGTEAMAGRRPGHGRREDKWLSPRHWQTYQSLFGWEKGLAVWYQLLPDVVLNDLCSNAEAVNYCLALGDTEEQSQ